MKTSDRYVLFFDLAWTGYTGWAIYDMLDDIWYDWGAFRPRQVKKGLERAAEVAFKHEQLYYGLQEVLRGAPDYTAVGYEYTDWHHGSGDASNVGQDRVVLAALAMAEITMLTAAGKYKIVGLGANHIRGEFGGVSKGDVARIIAAQWSAQFWIEKHPHGLLKSVRGVVRHDITDALAGAYVLARQLNLERMIDDG